MSTLHPNQEKISAEGLTAYAQEYCKKFNVNACFKGLSIVCEDVIPSTNDLAKSLNGIDGNVLITAEGQTLGRGRMGRNFYSPTGTGAYFTLRIRGERPFSEGVKFTPLASVAVCKAIENLTDKKPGIKWVNDVYVDNKKACGILTEAISDGDKITDVIIGIGVNLTNEAFPKDLPIAGNVCEGKLKREAIISAIVCEILQETPFITQNRHIPYYRAHSLALGKNITYYLNGTANEGVAMDVDDEGGLIVLTPSGNMVTLTGGEITLRIN